MKMPIELYNFLLDGPWKAINIDNLPVKTQKMCREYIEEMRPCFLELLQQPSKTSKKYFQNLSAGYNTILENNKDDVLFMNSFGAEIQRFSNATQSAADDNKNRIVESEHRITEMLLVMNNLLSLLETEDA